MITEHSLEWLGCMLTTESQNWPCLDGLPSLIQGVVPGEGEETYQEVHEGPKGD